MSKFEIGDIVTLKSHPLIKGDYEKIDCRPNMIPPLLLVKEVVFENSKKRQYSEDIDDKRVADTIKYICVYFNNNKSEFVETIVYEAFLKSYKELKYYRDDEEKKQGSIRLIEEVKDYLEGDYEFGKVVNFKTSKLESRKLYVTESNKNYDIYFTPQFILSGIKLNENKTQFYNDGTPRKRTSETLYKVLWYNHYQNKNSEIYLPKEFFIESFDTLVESKTISNKEIVNNGQSEEMKN